LTTDQTAALLGITRPTLREYRRKGYVTGYRIGTRVRYKRNEVLDNLQRMRTAKRDRP
jgi:excisionase family DNA binding protein